MWEPPLTLRQGMRNLPFTEDPPKEENVIGCFTEKYNFYISLEDVQSNKMQTWAAPVHAAYLEC